MMQEASKRRCNKIKFMSLSFVTKRHMSNFKFRFNMDTVREIHTALKIIMQCDVTVGYLYVIQSEISQERNKIMNYCKRNY